MICNNEVEIPVQCTRQPSKELWQLICTMLVKDPRRRITLDGILRHSFWQHCLPLDNALITEPRDEDACSNTSSVVVMLSIIQKLLAVFVVHVLIFVFKQTVATTVVPGQQTRRLNGLADARTRENSLSSNTKKVTS